jgi:oxalate decarboxylase/phosphoglucose isomerase-like protein (cupin superfamily)
MDPPESSRVSWVAADPDFLIDKRQRGELNIQCRKERLFARASPLRVTVRAGQVLYLPSLWFHQVSQAGPITIAVNFWHEMNFLSHHFAMYSCMASLGSTLHRRAGELDEAAEDGRCIERCA